MQEIKIENIQPIKNFVLLRPKNRPDETSEGIIIPQQSSAPTPVLGEVIAVGEESRFVIGDIVFFRRFSIDELKFNISGQEEIVSLISDDEIVAKIKNG